MGLLVGAIVCYGLYRVVKQARSRTATNDSVPMDEMMCKCYNVPRGAVPVLQAGPMAIFAETGPSFARFRSGKDPLKVKWGGSVSKMIWRLVGQDGLQAPHAMERRTDGSWLLNWTFSEPTCWCGPEATHYSGNGHCQAVYRSKERLLEFKMLRDASASPSGLN